MSDAIKPCPFCGAEPDSGNVGDHFVECPCCGTEGPYGFLPGAESAIEAWNTRAALAEVAMLRTGDTCARHCEGTAYRIEAQNLKRTIAAQTAKITRLCDQLAASEARAIELDAMLEHCRDEAAETERMLRAGYANAEARIRTLHILLARYRDETPIGHQPHMIAHQADVALGRAALAEQEAKP